jgi:endonuclease/exonuclease/phosphatase family metal-dependent hydrolase
MKNNDFTFICETWLLDYESTNLLNSLSSSHTIFHKSDMNFTPSKGRPFGGRAFIVKKHLTIKNFNFINKHIASITLNHREKTFTFISVYLPFDNKSFLNLTEFQSCLQIVNELFLFYTLNRHLVFIIGDFNSDLTRNNRFDIFLKHFIDNNNLYASSPSMSQCEFSYQNGLYKAKLDHCLLSKDISSPLILSYYDDNIINLSDHKPVIASFNYLEEMIPRNESKQDDKIEFITLYPNFDIDEVKDKFNNILVNEMEKFENIKIIGSDNKQQIIDDMYSQLTSSIKFAFDSCTRTTTLKSLNKKKWFTYELRNIKHQMLLIKYKNNHSSDDIEEIKRLKKNFKKIMKKNIFLYEKNELFKIEKLIKCNNSESFFRKVNHRLNKDKDKITLDVNELVNHYYSIFNRPLNVSEEIQNRVYNDIQDIIHDNFIPIEINITEFKYTIKQAKSSNVCGNDGISSRMIANCNSSFIT